MSLPSDTIRKYCYRCFKPDVVCICPSIVPVHNKTRIQILQHPLERHHPIGTARFAELGLKNATLKTVYATLDGSLATELQCTPQTGLLFPSADAVDLATVPKNARPNALIVLDGTWYNAKKLYRENPWLSTLPHYRLAPSRPSRYRIRVEPTRDSVSTLEAIVEALGILEPQTDCTALIRAFDAMIDRQVKYTTGGKGEPRRKRPRRRASHRIPRALVDNFDKIVMVYGENIRLENHRRAAVSLCATRMSDGAGFERFIRVSHDVVDRLPELQPSGILDNYYDEAVSEAALISEWQSFARPDDILCAWNKGTFQSLFQIPGFPRVPFLFLKAAFGNTVKEKFGTLEEVIEKLNLTTAPTPFTGRASQRMSNAIAVARHLHRQGKHEEENDDNQQRSCQLS